MGQNNYLTRRKLAPLGFVIQISKDGYKACIRQRNGEYLFINCDYHCTATNGGHKGEKLQVYYKDLELWPTAKSALVRCTDYPWCFDNNLKKAYKYLQRQVRKEQNS